MSRNSIRAALTFSFKGETRTLDSVIDLDRHLVESGEPPSFHRLLAQSAGIDPFSYLYEVLETYEIAFSDATGVAESCCRDGRLDWRKFERDRRDETDWATVRAIAERVLAPRDWTLAPEIKAALLAAYRAGKAGCE